MGLIDGVLKFKIALPRKAENMRRVASSSLKFVVLSTGSISKTLFRGPSEELENR